MLSSTGLCWPPVVLKLKLRDPPPLHTTVVPGSPDPEVKDENQSTDPGRARPLNQRGGEAGELRMVLDPQSENEGPHWQAPKAWPQRD